MSDLMEMTDRLTVKIEMIHAGPDGTRSVGDLSIDYPKMTRDVANVCQLDLLNAITERIADWAVTQGLQWGGGGTYTPALESAAKRLKDLSVKSQAVFDPPGKPVK